MHTCCTKYFTRQVQVSSPWIGFHQGGVGSQIWCPQWVSARQVNAWGVFRELRSLRVHRQCINCRFSFFDIAHPAGNVSKRQRLECPSVLQNGTFVVEFVLLKLSIEMVKGLDCFPMVSQWLPSKMRSLDPPCCCDLLYLTCNYQQMNVMRAMPCICIDQKRIAHLSTPFPTTWLWSPTTWSTQECKVRTTFSSFWRSSAPKRSPERSRAPEKVVQHSWT